MHLPAEAVGVRVQRRVDTRNLATVTVIEAPAGGAGLSAADASASSRTNAGLARRLPLAVAVEETVEARRVM